MTLLIIFLMSDMCLYGLPYGGFLYRWANHKREMWDFCGSYREKVCFSEHEKQEREGRQYCPLLFKSWFGGEARKWPTDAIAYDSIRQKYIFPDDNEIIHGSPNGC